MGPHLMVLPLRNTVGTGGFPQSDIPSTCSLLVATSQCRTQKMENWSGLGFVADEKRKDQKVLNCSRILG